MNPLAHRQLPPSPRDAAIARSSGQVLSHYAGMAQSLKLRVREGGQEQLIELPARAVDVLMHVLESMAEGQGVKLIPDGAELTTVQAADVLNVSRSFLIKLLDQKAIPHRKGRQAPPYPHGRCHGVQGYDRPGARTGSRPVDPRGSGPGHGIWPAVTRAMRSGLREPDAGGAPQVPRLGTNTDTRPGPHVANRPATIAKHLPTRRYQRRSGRW